MKVEGGRERVAGICWEAEDWRAPVGEVGGEGGGKG